MNVPIQLLLRGVGLGVHDALAVDLALPRLYARATSQQRKYSEQRDETDNHAACRILSFGAAPGYSPGLRCDRCGYRRRILLPER